MLDQTGVVFSPLAGPPGVLPSLLDQAGTTFSPTVLNGGSPQTVTIDALLDSSGVTFAPLVGPPGLTPGLLEQIGATFDPAVALKVAMGLIDQTALVFGPQVAGPQTVTATLIDQTAVIYDVSVSGGAGGDPWDLEAQYQEWHRQNHPGCDRPWAHRHYERGIYRPYTPGWWSP